MQASTKNFTVISKSDLIGFLRNAGYSWKKVATTLNKQGITTTTGRQWTNMSALMAFKRSTGKKKGNGNTAA
tara:strand:- start:439 stop:654 length:216 start_codon:yes stop_codon:yes gene_type:complete